MRRIKKTEKTEDSKAPDPLDDDLGEALDRSIAGDLASDPLPKKDDAVGRAIARKSAAGDVSKDLGAAMAAAEKEAEGAEREARRAKSRGILFEDANAPKNVGVPPGMASVVEKVFLRDQEFDAAYDQIHASLSLGEKLTDHGHLVRALDGAETMHRLAHRLYVSAKVERSSWERDTAITSAALRSEATKVLQHEKEHGKRNKTITDADVDSTCAWLFPDEWKSQQSQRDRLKYAEDSLGNLVEVCASRCRTLQALLTKHR